MAAQPLRGKDCSSDAPRVLFVNHTGVLGGAEQYLYDYVTSYSGSSVTALFEDGALARDLREAGMDVRIIKVPDSIHSVRREAGPLSALKGAMGVLTSARAIARLAQDVDVIFANSQKSMLAAGAAGQIVGTPVVWSLHDLLGDEHFSFLNRHIAKLAANLFVDYLLANSNATLEAFQRLGGRVPATVVPNGIDALRFQNVDPNVRSRLRTSIGIPSDVPVAGVFSRIAEWKGQDILIRALPDIPGLHVALVGEAMFRGDETYARDLRSLTCTLGVSDRVHFCGFRRDIPDLMNMVDIVVHTSKESEPFGRVIVEGLLAERPVVATRAGGAREILSTPGTGYLVDPGSVSQLRDALRHVVSHPGEARRFARAGKALSLDRYTLPTMVNSITSALHRVASTV